MIATFALAVAFAAGVRWIGWLAIPALAALWGFWAGAHAWAGRRAAIAVAVACLGWFAVDVAHGRFGVLVRTVGGVFSLPGVLVIFMTLAFAAALAWSAATVGAATSRRDPP